MSVDKDGRAARLFLGSVEIGRIKAECGFRDVRSAEAAVMRGLREMGRGKSSATQRIAELERLDMMHRALFPKALKGDTDAVEKCLRISERRERLVAEPDRQTGILQAFDESVAALKTGVPDRALVAAGRAVAQQIDYAVRFLLGADVTKALYLVPQLVNVLRELGATPAARDAVIAAAPSEKDDLAAFRDRHGVA